MVDPEIKQFGDVIIAVWAGSKIVCEFTRFHEHRDSLSAELTVSNEGGVLHWSRANLASATGRRDVIKALEEVHPIPGWRAMLDRACQLVARHLRTGEPSILLVPAPPKEERWLVNDWMPRDEITVLYGSGGSAKSLLCLATGLAGVLGHTLGGPWSVGHVNRVLYLDWEDHADTQRARMWGLTHQIEAPTAGAFLYRRLRRPLVDVIADLRREAFVNEIDLVIMDSLGAACGPEPETAGSALGALQAVGSLPGTKLVIAHVSKAGAAEAKAKPFGSVYIENTARSTIEARGVKEDNEILVTLRHDKANHGRTARPVGVTAAFLPDGTITLSHGRPDDSSLSLASQVLTALGQTDSSVSGIARLIDANPKSVKATLQRLENRGTVRRLESVTGGKGKEQQWTRADANRLGE